MAKTLGELADHVGGRVVGDPDVVVRRMAAIGDAQEGDLTFLSNPRYAPALARTGATAAIVGPGVTLGTGNYVICDNAYLAFARAASLLGEPAPKQAMGVDPLACVSGSAVLGEQVSLGPFVTVEAGCRLGNRVVLMPGVYLGPDVTVGDDTVLHPNVAVYHGCEVGRRVTLHANVVIGSDGFGFAPDGERYEKIPQMRAAILGDDVSIGANTTVNRGALRETIVGHGCKIDSSCVISHGVQIAPHALLVSHVGVSGTVNIGRHVTLAGQVGVAGHLTIGDNVRVGAQSGVSHDLAPDAEYLGTPARKIADARRTEAVCSRLPALREEVRRLTREVGALSRRLDKG